MVVFFCISLILILGSGVGQELLGRHETIQFRLNVWLEGIEMIKDRLFFGHGINTFMRIFQAYRENLHLGLTYAHNCYIQLAAETGIVGLLCFLWIIVKVFQQLLGNIKHIIAQDQNCGVLAIGLLSGIFAFLVHSFFDTNFYSLQLSFYLCFWVGYFLSFEKFFNSLNLGKIINIIQ